jgi:predicted alpha/beta hydrolase family esterase
MRHAVDSQPVLFIQGAGSMHEPEGSGRLAAYLARELGTDYRLIAPEMPDADNPHYQPWRDRIEQELEAIDGKVIFVGHSFGGSVLLNYLAEGSYRKPIRGLFLVSVPNWGPDGWAYDEFAVPNDVGSRLPASRIFLYHSRDDPEVPFAHLAYYQDRLPTATARPIDGSEHSFIEGLPTLVDDVKSLPR